jgi:hypothetical protein
MLMCASDLESLEATPGYRLSKGMAKRPFTAPTVFGRNKDGLLLRRQHSLGSPPECSSALSISECGPDHCGNAL